MAKYFKDGNTVSVAPDRATEILDQLPANIYTLRFAMLRGFYLELVDDLTQPKHIYGDIENKVDRIIKTYDARDGNTGVLLSGEKGSGKTMMAKMISIKNIARNIPTIIINNDFEQDFCKFISDINQKCVIIFDEFEKVFDKKESQSKLLTLFEGTYTSNKLILLTVNSTWDVNTYFLNRPGRLYYHIKFDSLEESFIEEYCNKNLDNKTYKDSVVNLSKLIPKFNFDMLQAIVFESNLHNESPQKTFGLLNINNISAQHEYDFEIIDTNNGNKYTGSHSLTPFSESVFYFEHYSNEKYIGDKDEDGELLDDSSKYIKLTESNLIGAKSGAFEFKDRNFKIKITKSKKSHFFLDF